jgi:hypothetical protein
MDPITDYREHAAGLVRAYAVLIEQQEQAMRAEDDAERYLAMADHLSRLRAEQRRLVIRIVNSDPL